MVLPPATCNATFEAARIRSGTPPTLSILIATLNVTPILATLATMTLFNGVAIGITNGISVSDLPKEFIRVGNGTFFGIPTPFILMVAIAAFVGYLINRTGLGLKILLIGTRCGKTDSAIG